jgi:hypothetical protein
MGRAGRNGTSSVCPQFYSPRIASRWPTFWRCPRAVRRPLKNLCDPRRHVQTAVTQLQRMLHSVKLSRFLLRRPLFLFSIHGISSATCVARGRTPDGLSKNELTICKRTPRLARIVGILSYCNIRCITMNCKHYAIAWWRNAPFQGG